MNEGCVGRYGPYNFQFADVMQRYTPAGIFVIILTAIGAVMWDNYTPLSSDDWCYLTIPVGDDSMPFWHCEGPRIDSASDVWTAVRRHFELVNGRLANAILFPFAHHHRTLALLCGIAIGLWAFAMALAGDCRRRLTAASAWTAALCLWIVFPWCDNMQSTAYQANYVLPSLMICGLIPMTDDYDSAGRRKCILTAAYAFICGCMHEGFSMILIVYMLTRLIFRQNRLSWKYFVLVAAVAAGTGATLLGGIFIRMRQQTAIFDYSQLAGHISRIIMSMWPLAMAIILVIALKICRKTPWQLIGRRYGALTAGALAGAAMPVALMLFDRVYWPMYLMCALIIIGAVSELVQGLKINKALSIGAFAIFTALYAAWTVRLCAYESAMAREWQAETACLETAVKKNAPTPGVIPLDVLRNDGIPWWLMGLVRQPLEKHDSADRLGWYYGCGAGTILPADSSYARLPLEQWPAIPGGTGIRGRWPFIASADSSLTHYIFVFGAPDANMPPADRLLSRFSGAGDTVEHKLIWWAKPVLNSNGEEFYRIYIDDMPRTLRHRPLLSIRKP